MGYEICATEETAATLAVAGLEVTHLHWPESGKQPNIDDAIRNKELQMVFMFSNQLSVCGHSLTCTEANLRLCTAAAITL